MSTMQPTLSVLCLLVSIGVSLAWYRNPSNPVYGGWSPHRRSHYTRCVEESGFCKGSYNCCGNNVCSFQPPFGIGICKPLGQYNGVYPEYGLKKADQECKTSLECIDQCCRRIRIGRSGYKQRCGKPGEYMCVGGNENDVYG